MTHSAIHASTDVLESNAGIAADPDEFGRLLGPVMAGARARGVADAFELMGVAAVLIDSAGRVLHAGGRAERALLPLVRIVENHLIGGDAHINECLQKVIESGLRREEEDVGSPSAVELCDDGGRPRLTMKAIRFPAEGPSAVQLLRAVIVVTELDRCSARL